MNKERRKTIAKLREQLEEIASELENLADEEQDAYNNLPESLQQSERGTMMEDAATNLECAFESIREVISNLEDAEA